MVLMKSDHVMLVHIKAAKKGLFVLDTTSAATKKLAFQKWSKVTQK